MASWKRPTVPKLVRLDLTRHRLHKATGEILTLVMLLHGSLNREHLTFSCH